jgi:hypothetical protein
MNAPPEISHSSRLRALAFAHPALVIGACAIVPTILIDFVSRLFGPTLRPLLPPGIELTNLKNSRYIFELFTWPRDDSWWPMQKALAVLNGPHARTLYETLFFGEKVRFQYPPTSLLPINALASVGLSSSQALNAINMAVFALNAAAIGFFVWLLLSAKRTGPQSPLAASLINNRKSLSVLAACLPIVFYPLVRAGVLGQIQLWIDLFFTCSLILWVTDRRMASGLFAGLACAIKPQLMILFLWALLWRERRFAAGLLAGWIPFVALSIGLYGLHDNVEYLNVLSFLGKRGESFFANNSINGILNWYISPEGSLWWENYKFAPYNPIVYFGTLAAALLFIGGILAVPLRTRRPADVSDLGIAALCIAASSPIAWEHHYGIALPLFFVALSQIANAGRSAGRTRMLLLLWVSWILAANFISGIVLLDKTPFAILQANTFMGVLILIGLLLGNAPVSRADTRIAGV